MVFRRRVAAPTASFVPEELIIVDDSESEVETDEFPGSCLFEDFPRHVKFTKRERSPTQMDINTLPSPASKHRRLQTRSGRAVVPSSSGGRVRSFLPLSSTSPLPHQSNPMKRKVVRNEEVIVVQSDEEHGGCGKKEDRGGSPMVLCGMCARKSTASSSSMVPCSCSTLTHHQHATSSTSRHATPKHIHATQKHMKGSTPMKKSSSSAVVGGSHGSRGSCSSPGSKRARYGACFVPHGGSHTESSPRHLQAGRWSHKVLSPNCLDHGILRPHEEKTDLFSKLPQVLVEQIAEYFSQGSRFKMCIVHRSFHFLQEARWNDVIDLRSVGIGTKLLCSGRRIVQRRNLNSQLSIIRDFLTINLLRFRESKVLLMRARQFLNLYEHLSPLVEELCPELRILHLINSFSDSLGVDKTTTYLMEKAFKGRQIDMVIIQQDFKERYIMGSALHPMEPYIIKVEPLSLDVCTAFLSKNSPCLRKRISGKLYCDRHLKCRQVLHYSFSRQRAIQEEYNKR